MTTDSPAPEPPGGDAPRPQPAPTSVAVAAPAASPAPPAKAARSADLRPAPPRGAWRRRMLFGVQVAVWVGACALALREYQRVGGRLTLAGYARSQTVVLAPQVAGAVREIRVRLHEPVEAGQVLAAMDDQRERLALAAIEADVARLRATVSAEQIRLTTERSTAFERAEDTARSFLIDRQAAQLGYLSRAVDDAMDRILLRGAEAELSVVLGLQAQSAASAREVQQIETQVSALRAKIEANHTALDEEQAAFQAADRRWAEYRQQRSEPPDYDPALTPTRLAVDVRERELAEIVRQIDAQVIRAPFRGQVTAILAEPGAALAAGAPLIMIATTDTQEVIAYLPDTWARSARVGDELEVRRIAARAGEPLALRGTVESLAAVVSEAPLRYRTIQATPVWGREILVSVGPATLVPGEAVQLDFARR